jgi:hypothetical protein
MYKHFIGSLLAFSNNFFPKLFENVSFGGFVVFSFSLGVVILQKKKKFRKRRRNKKELIEIKKNPFF